MLSLPRNLTSTSPWSSVSSPQFLAQLGFRPDQPGDLRSLLRDHRQARVLEGCAQLSGSGKVTLRGAGDFGQSPDRESRKNPQRWGKAGSKVTVTVAGFRTALLCGSGRVGHILGLPASWLYTGYLGASQNGGSCLTPSHCFTHLCTTCSTFSFSFFLL